MLLRELILHRDQCEFLEKSSSVASRTMQRLHKAGLELFAPKPFN